MGWLGPVVGNVQHEGWVVPLFADGAEGNGSSSAAGIYVSTPSGVDEVRPDAAVVGWRAGCECEWRGRPWTRVHSAAAAGAEAWHSDGSVVDETHRLIFQPGGFYDLDNVAERVVIDEWREHIAPFKAVESVEEAAAKYGAAGRELDNAVAAARAAGASWADIGRAVGISRQSAHERWGGRWK